VTEAGKAATAPPATLRLSAPLHAITARLSEDGTITCGTLRLCKARCPVVEICRRLRQAGVPDIALQVALEGAGTPLLVLSIHATADWSDAALGLENRK
jgi:hypothetical protein